MSSGLLKPILFTILFLVANGAFAWSIWRLVRLARLGVTHHTPIQAIGDRLKDVLVYVFFQKRVVDRKFGYNHVIIFWSFLVIGVGHLEFMLSGLFPSFNIGMLPSFPAYPILYAADLMAFVVLFAIAISLFRRIVVRPWFIAYSSLDGFAVLGQIALVQITYFVATSAGLSGVRPDLEAHASIYPISSLFAGLASPVV